MNEVAFSLVILSLVIVGIFFLGLMAYYLNKMTGVFDQLLAMGKKEMNPV